jgi:Tfp pilus assembly protein PilF
LAYAIIKAKKRSVIAYGIFFFFITFSIVSNLFFNVGTSMAERFIYMPSVGFSIVAGVIIARVTGFSKLGQFPNRFKVGVCILIIAFPLSYKTIARNKVWENNFVLYEEDVNNAPNSARIHLYYGIELIGRYNKTNQIEILHQAKEEIKKAIQINPDFYHAHYNLAVAHEKDGEIDAAIQSHKRVLEIKPQHIKSTLGLGLLYGKVKKEYALSVIYFNLLMNSNYREANLFDNLGVAHAMLGNFTSAAVSFEKGVSYHPNNARLHFNLAITYNNLGLKEKAEKHYEQAFSIDPGLQKVN